METTATFTTVRTPFSVFCVTCRILPLEILENPLATEEVLVLPAELVFADGDFSVVEVPLDVPPTETSLSDLMLGAEAVPPEVDSLSPTGINNVVVFPVNVSSEEDAVVLAGCVPRARMTSFPTMEVTLPRIAVSSEIPLDVSLLFF